jgi:hypothetical protein
VNSEIENERNDIHQRKLLIFVYSERLLRKLVNADLFKVQLRLNLRSSEVKLFVQCFGQEKVRKFFLSVII